MHVCVLALLSISLGSFERFECTYRHLQPKLTFRVHYFKNFKSKTKVTKSLFIFYLISTFNSAATVYISKFETKLLKIQIKKLLKKENNFH